MGREESEPRMKKPTMDLAERLKKPQSFVSKYESGERRLDLVELNEVCDKIGIRLMTFVRRFVKH
jgi:ppGpp synthetase/RelA/SpoT-type nucleotidyltranferase